MTPRFHTFKGKRLREFSAIGPCIELGTVIHHTPRGVTYQGDPNGGLPGKVLRRGGVAWVGVPDPAFHRAPGYGTLHVFPCPSCRDHPQTQYPNGYMD